VDKRLQQINFVIHISLRMFTSMPHASLIKRNHCFQNKTIKSISTDVLLQKSALLIFFLQVTLFILHSMLVSWQIYFMFFLIAFTQIRSFRQRKLHTSLHLQLNSATTVNPPTDVLQLT